MQDRVAWTSLTASLIVPAVGLGVALGFVLAVISGGWKGSVLDVPPAIMGFSGAGLTAAGAVSLYWIRRRHIRQGVLKALYAEVFNRAARCVLDSDTWRSSLVAGKTWGSKDLGKFRPVEPVIFPAVAIHLGSLPDGTLSALMMFYFRLDAVRRDVDQGPWDSSIPLLGDGQKKLFAHRLNETLRPALEALDTMAFEISKFSDATQLTRALEASHAVFLKGKDIRLALAEGIEEAGL